MTTDFLEQVEQQLVEATERGARRRRLWRLPFRLPTLTVMAGVLVAATATALAADLALPVHHLGPRSVPTLTSSGVSGTADDTGPPSGGPVPVGFQPQSFTATGEFSWWLMGQAPCGNPPCTSIVRTENGGRSFVGIPAPRTDRISQLRFANSLDGYAYLPQLWSTDNGGTTWRRVRLGGEVDGLMASGPYVYAVVLGSGSGQADRLMRSAVGSDRWSAIATIGRVAPGLWAQGADVVVWRQEKTTQLLTSDDYGASFTVHQAGETAGCQPDQVSAAVIWNRCSGGLSAGVARSTDGGMRFSSAMGKLGSPVPEMPNSMVFGAASADAAVIGFRRLYVTDDGGATYRRSDAPLAGSWVYVGFTDSTHGVAIALDRNSSYRLYYTVDGGQSYHMVPIGGA